MTDRSGILKNSPLIYTLASIRFAPWPIMAKMIDEIQNELREITPITHTVEIQQLAPDNKEGPTTKSWILLSTDRQLGITLSPDQLLIFSTKYTRYVDFNKNLEKALDALIKRMKFIDVINIGMRYVDCIEIEKEKEFKDYIATGLLPAEIGSLKVVGGASITTYALNNSILQVRCITQPDQYAIPLDLIQLHMIIHGPTNNRIGKLDGNKFLLDMDASSIFPNSKRMTDKNEIQVLLDSLHTHANEFFRHEDVCKDFAFKVWKGEE